MYLLDILSTSPTTSIVNEQGRQMRILSLILRLKGLSAINLRNTGEGHILQHPLLKFSFFLLLKENTKAPRGTKSFVFFYETNVFFLCVINC